jgi:hypothetical protein
MKNYKVEATMKFTDKEENGIKRNVGDIFETTKERYEFLKQNNAVKLIEIQETVESVIKEKKEYVVPVKQMEELVEKAIIEKPKKKKSNKK